MVETKGYNPFKYSTSIAQTQPSDMGLSAKIATLKLIPYVKPPRKERYPGNYPTTESESQTAEEAERDAQIKRDTRELIFTQEKRNFTIGRASGNPVRGLIARRNNAYFLSPVMSRYHAEVHVDTNNEMRLKDTNSMHGTFINGEPIWAGEWKVIQSGDVITFGARVARDGETFEPKDFKCEIQWEKIRSVTPKLSNEMPTKLSRSGYGLRREDLIISDDDTESVDYDKGPTDYTPYTDEEEYTNHSDVDEEEEDEVDEVDDFDDDLDEIESIASSGYDGGDVGIFDTDSMPSSPTQPIQTQQVPITSASKNVEETIKLASQPKITATTDPLLDRKFSIGNLINETADEQPKAQELKMMESDATSISKPSEATNNKGKEKETLAVPAEASTEKSKQIQFWSPHVFSALSKAREATERASLAKEKIVTLVDNEKEERKNSTNSLPVLKSMQDTPSDIRNNDLEIGKTENVKPASGPTSSPTCLQTLNLELLTKMSSSGEKPTSVVEDPIPCTNMVTKPSSAPNAKAAEKQDFFAARKENVARGQLLWKTSTKPVLDEITTPTLAQQSYNTPTLPWVHNFVQLSTEKQAVDTPSSASENQPRPIPVVSSANEPSTSHGRHVFEQILSSDEAFARTEALNRLKAVISIHNKDIQRSKNCESGIYGFQYLGSKPEIYQQEGEEDEEGPESILRSTRQQSEPANSMQNTSESSNATTRSFAINNLLQDSTDYRKWVAEKVKKAGGTPPSQNATGKRKHDDISKDEKYVKETEEKIQFSDAMECDHSCNEAAREVSQEKETYQDTCTSIAELKGKERPTEAVAVVKATMEKVVTFDAERDQPTRKKSRMWSGATGFALGAVTGAVGVFAALVASSAP